MIGNRVLEWLGVNRRAQAVGVHIATGHVGVVVLRDRPIRLVAVGRAATGAGVVVDNDIRLIASVAETLGRIVDQLRVTPEAHVVAIVEPVAQGLDLSSGSECVVPLRRYEQTAEVVRRAGLRLGQVDVVPASLARLAQLFGPEPVAVSAGGRWIVCGDPDLLCAEPVADRQGWAGLRVGRAIDSMEPVTALPRIEVPRALRDHLDPALDGLAVGAAMAGFEHRPLVRVRVEDVPVGNRWIAEPVTSVLGQGAR